MIKVSVIVPTYQPGEGLNRLVASLDAQSLPRDEFEVIFVDDGSPDDTAERLREIASTRPHVRVEQIPNSGWPSRPRNVGIDLARGEYVLFLDHDDTIYPDGLRAAYNFAAANGADALNGKEVRTHMAGWGVSSFTGDLPNVQGRDGMPPLQPMTPHKLYRREFLDTHGIRFREGGKVFWEDIFFNLKVQRHASVISTLSSVPVYHWQATEGSGSTGFLRSSPDFWRWLREIFVATNDELGAPELREAREGMLLHQYRGRLLASFNGAFAKRPESERAMIFAECRSIQAEFIPEELDERLNSTDRMRARLLRDGDLSGLVRLPAVDPGLPGVASLIDAMWENGALRLNAEVIWQSKSGRRHDLVRSEGRIYKRTAATSDIGGSRQLVDVTDEIEGASAEYSARDRTSRASWSVPSRSEVDVSSDAKPEFVVRVQGDFDPSDVRGGAPAEKGAYDIHVRAMLAGSASHRRLSSTIPPLLTTDGVQSALAYTNADGFLSVDIDQGVRRLGHALELDLALAQTGIEDGRLSLSVPLPGTDVRGDGEIETTVRAARPVSRPGLIARLRGARAPEAKISTIPAAIVCADGAATLVARFPEDWVAADLIVAGREDAPQRITAKESLS